MRVRRSPHLVVYWRAGGLTAFNYATRAASPITPFLCQLLDACGDWTTLAALRATLGTPASTPLRPLIERLISRSLLVRAGRREDSRSQAMARLEAWNPEAGFFHAATRDVPFASPRRAARQATLQAATWPKPPTVKRYPGATVLELPRPRAEGAFADVLRARRTFRRFSRRPIHRDDLATILGLTVGIQQWVETGEGQVALKTSPSGGARHAIEAYVVVRDVVGIKAGIYHYAPDRHELERIGKAVPLARQRAYLPNSGYFAAASAMVFFTAIFERILWRYPYSRAYRAALVEAGHVCQTFCLTATWLGLAPYCVMGLADSLIEEDLGLDGISESVLYAAGVGRAPVGTAWAPLTRGTLNATRNPRL